MQVIYTRGNHDDKIAGRSCPSRSTISALVRHIHGGASQPLPGHPRRQIRPRHLKPKWMAQAPK